MFMAEVVAVNADEKYFDEMLLFLLKKEKPIFIPIKEENGKLVWDVKE